MRFEGGQLLYLTEERIKQAEKGDEKMMARLMKQAPRWQQERQNNVGAARHCNKANAYSCT